jgi:gliding motility associated protien GldN
MRTFLLTLLGLCPTLAFAQPGAANGAEQSTTAVSSPSVRPIPNSDVMYRKSIWRVIDLREKQNKPMFANNHQITKIIVEAVKAGKLQPYRGDSLTATFSLADFNKKLIVPDAAPTMSEEEKKLGFTEDENSGGGGWGDEPAGGAKPAAPTAFEYYPQDLYQMEMKEDMVFDKKRSRMYHEIQSITLVIPAAKTPKGYDLPIATFKWADLVKVFRDNPEQAIWFNGSNTAQHKNLADAFDLWMFSSYISKVSNADDKQLADIYGGDQQGIMAAQQIAGEMIEYEYNLWSF